MLLTYDGIGIVRTFILDIKKFSLCVAEQLALGQTVKLTTGLHFRKNILNPQDFQELSQSKVSHPPCKIRHYMCVYSRKKAERQSLIFSLGKQKFSYTFFGRFSLMFL